MTKIAVKLDENLAQTHVEFLQQAGYNAERVTDEDCLGQMMILSGSKCVPKDAFSLLLT